MQKQMVMTVSVCFCLLAFVGCGTTAPEADPLANISDLQVKTAFDSTTSFPKQAAYKFVRLEPEREGYNPEATKMYRRIRQSLQQQLLSKGYRHSDGSGSAQYVVDYRVVGRQSRDLVTQRVEDDGRQWLEVAGVGAEFAEGSLIIDVIDVNTLKPVWRGVSNLKIQMQAVSDSVKDRRVEYIVSKILEDFPPNSQ